MVVRFAKLAIATASGCANPTLMKKHTAMVKISTQMNASSLRAPHACKNKNVNVSAPVTVVSKGYRACVVTERRGVLNVNAL